MFDILIKNGTVIDGSGARRFRADVAVSDGAVAAIGDLALDDAHEVIDAEGKFVTPGFVDINNRSDAYWKIFANPTLDSMALQGVTTIVGGNSGSSLAPLLRPEMIKSIQRWIDVSRLNIDWQEMDEFLSAVSRRRLSLNFATLVGHSTLRRALLGGGDRSLSGEELKVLKAVLRRSLSAGALGLSAALLYAHSRTTTPEELTALAEVVAAEDGILTVYLSDEKEGLLDSLSAKIKVAERTGAKLHISHLKAVGEKNHHLLEKALKMIIAARNDGLEITCDVYPYTVMSAVMYTLLPDWITDGGRVKMMPRLRDPQLRRKALAEMRADRTINFAEAVVSVSPVVKNLSRRRIGDIAADREQTPEETIIDLLLAGEGQGMVLIDALGEDGLRAAMREDFCFVASNGAGYNLADRADGENIHPRNFGAFARFLGRYVREEKLLEWEEAIAKITSLPARRYGLGERGIL
ncbi:MAG TPA: hypothetical protein ENJ77_00640, partial [Candidatus Moranbacteria bacterium]|nr:hypothetical protein [Candidatus Moranbacteria bacterium]